MTNKLMLLSVVLLAAATTAMAAQADQWIHVRVVSADSKGETVSVNVPMSFAEKVIPTICADKFHGGKVRINGHMNDVDLRALFEAIRTTPDNEFVTVKSRDEDVRVAKSGGNLLIHVQEKHADKHTLGDKVEVKVPITVVQALLSGNKDELDIAAGLRALSALGAVELVNVNDNSETVRIWTDTRSSTD